LAESGNIEDVFNNPGHPYTIGLFRAFPSIKGPIKNLSALSGAPPNLARALSGCRFAPRCPRKEKLCERETPSGLELEGGHIAFCHFAKDKKLKHIDFGELHE
jgi:oligopeptide/dipeptide ABC transporter ATP-binding protein